MPAFYKVRKYKKQVGMPEGEDAFHAINSSVGLMTADDVAEYVSKRSGVSVGQVRGLLNDIAEIVKESMLRGENVELGNLGIMQIKCSSIPADTAENLTTSNIRKVYPHLRMRKKLKSKVENIRFVKAKYTATKPVVEDTVP